MKKFVFISVLSILCVFNAVTVIAQDIQNEVDSPIVNMISYEVDSAASYQSALKPEKLARLSKQAIKIVNSYRSRDRYGRFPKWYDIRQTAAVDWYNLTGEWPEEFRKEEILLISWGIVIR